MDAFHPNGYAARQGQETEGGRDSCSREHKVLFRHRPLCGFNMNILVTIHHNCASYLWMPSAPTPSHQHCTHSGVPNTCLVRCPLQLPDGPSHSGLRKEPKARGTTQVVEHLPGKHEALSSNPSSSEKQNKTERSLGFTKRGAQ
jgi:hypothetical protein